MRYPLTDEMRDGGADLIRALDRTKFSVPAALWLYDESRDAWRFLIATPEVNLGGPLKAYNKITKVMSRIWKNRMPIESSQIALTPPSSSIVKGLAGTISTEREIEGILVKEAVIDGVRYPDMYIYRQTIHR